jgi:hypothetical protein
VEHENASYLPLDQTNRLGGSPMITNALGRCLTFINCQIASHTAKPGLGTGASAKRSITISRLTGSGSHVIADLLVEKLQAKAPEESCPWTVFDKNLVEKVLEDHKLPSRLARFMPEDRISELSDTMDELFGLHPSSWTLVHKAAETMLHLAEIGNVILIGRGANLVTAQLPHVFHVRLVGSVEKRAKHVEEYYGKNARDAMEFLKQEDEGRRRFMRKYFERDVEDPLLYHLVINTDLVSYEETANLIVRAVTDHVAAPAAQPAPDRIAG